ncbi:MAG: stage 0 sporulation family protein [Clostridia bacterium]|nr:stage 0 sporulation family protein [Clostridia bacterium]
MPRVVSVQFREAGKTYYFDPGNFVLQKGDAVIVETAQGKELAIVDEIKEVSEDELVAPLKSIIRQADANDLAQYDENKQKEKEAFRVCQEKIESRGLNMRLVDVEYTFDRRKMIFYFTADGRIDFRELVKDLAAIFHTRIELRQIGVRDEARMIGGIGICGRELCCCSYLSDFVPVSIKMAKVQNLSMNPAKISGVCGRLLCCLQYEHEAYEDASSRMPRPGTVVMTDEGQGVIEHVNLLKETVTVRLDRGGEMDLVTLPYAALTILENRSEKRSPTDAAQDEKQAGTGPSRKKKKTEGKTVPDQTSKKQTDEKPVKKRAGHKTSSNRRRSRSSAKKRRSSGGAPKQETGNQPGS